MTDKALSEALGEPVTLGLARIDGQPLSKSLPSRWVASAVWDDWNDEDEEDLRLIDFGESFQPGAETKKLADPQCLPAPETIFTSTLDFGSEKWSAGIMVRKFYAYFSRSILTLILGSFMTSFLGHFHS